MKKIFLFLVVTFVLFASISNVLADGMLHIYDRDMWNLFTEDQQFCAINYNEGIQNMILSVNSGELTGQKAVWIFPVPAKPEEVKINIIEGFPQLAGYDIEEEIGDSLSIMFTFMRVSQIYTLPLLITRGLIMGGAGAALKGTEGMTIYQTVEKNGVTTELVSAKDTSSLTNYLSEKGLVLSENAQSILQEYIGKEYSFVVYWISDIEKYKELGGHSNSMGVFISFQTDKIYYPLKPTSIYGSRVIPAVIYVLDYVEPELYEGIKANAEVNYYKETYLTIPKGLIDFFTGYKTEPMKTYNPDIKEYDYKEGILKINEDVKYTKIKINSISEDLTEDLWIKASPPANIKLIDFIGTQGTWFFFVLFFIISSLSSLIAGLVIFRGKNSVSKPMLALLGLANILSLIGFSIFAYLKTGDKSNMKQKQSKKNSHPIKKIIITILIISGIICFIFLALITIPSLRYFSIFSVIYSLFFLIFLFPFICLLVAPFVYGFYENRKALKFILLFSAIFIVLTIIFEKILILLLNSL